MKKNFIKSFAGDLSYSILALVLLNGIIQLLMYPYLSRQMGADSFGVVLSILSVISIVATSFGTGANYSRMVVSTKQKEIFGDYNIFLIIVCALSLIVSVITAINLSDASVISIISISLLMIFSILRYYGDVNFRLSLNYKGFFLYYAAISLGYILGLLSYGIFGSWCIALLMGEVFATVFVSIKGKIYKKPFFKKSENFKENIKSMLALSSAYFISNIVMNADRILLLMFVGSMEVTVFYTATLIGKVIALLTSPLNGVIVGYLSRYKGEFTKKMMSILTVALLGVGMLVIVMSVLASYVFVGIMYPEVFEQAKGLFLIANAGQIFYFISETYLVVVLRFTKERLQLYINIIYAVVFFTVAIPAVIFEGVYGIAYAILALNIFRFVIIAIVGIKCSNKKQIIEIS